MATGQIFTDLGQAFAVDQLDANTATATPTWWLHWGAGSNTPAVTDTVLQTPNAESRVQITTGGQTQVTTQSTGDTMRWTGTMIATGSRTVQEVAIYTASTGSNARIRIVHGSLALESGDQVTYTINLQIKDTIE